MKSKIFLLAVTILLLSKFTSFAGGPTQAEIKEKIQTKTEAQITQTSTKNLTADEFLKRLRERAELKLKERRLKMLRKFKGSFGLSYGYEDNPNYSNPTTHIQSASFIEQDFSLAWLPTFNKFLGANVSYNLAKQDYLTFGTLTYYDHIANTSLKYYPYHSLKLILEPGASYEWLIFPHDPSSDYTQLKGFLKLTYSPSRLWSFGGKYERAHKIFTKKYARNPSQVDLRFDRVDYRDAVELWAKRNIGKYSIKLRGRGYGNRSNDKFQNYYDYNDYMGSLTFGGSFLPKDKLYLSFTPGFEWKDYTDRSATGGKRFDHITTYRLDAYYSITKNITLNYSFSVRRSNSNAATGEYNDTIHQLGFIVDF